MTLLRQIVGWLRGLLGNKPVVTLGRDDHVRLAMEAANLRGQDWRGVKATEAFLQSYSIPEDLSGEALKKAITEAAQAWRKEHGHRFN